MNKTQEIKASLQNICLSLNHQQILKNINLELKAGEIATLIGPNGGGKTCIARILTRILKPTSGKVLVKKEAKIGYMPQKLEIEKTIPLRVIDFLELGHQEKQILPSDIIERLQIKNILDKSIHKISGGQLQKVLFVKTLMNQPEILILDEPTSYMDIGSQGEVYKIIEEIRANKNCAILIISHDLHIVMQKTDQVICVNHHICCEGTPESISDHPEYLSLFGKKQDEQKIGNVAIYSHHHDHNH